ncbi:hypothetical protein L3X38_040116 [Prunus dulcis]|uniref:Transmembrane protein 234 homolog n=1 Tax=Prunus dulcis TaxID=3755 RepID=A0AAD4YTS1_PRUDU|nr:hypothetical protein L3X38_040116 [Prunus dulcis]
MIGDVEKMMAVGLVWGATNALMRRGALLWDQALKSSSSAQAQAQPGRIHHKLLTSLKSWLKLLSIWQYTVPFFVNLSASATFFAILSHTPNLLGRARHQCDDVCRHCRLWVALGGTDPPRPRFVRYGFDCFGHLALYHVIGISSFLID